MADRAARGRARGRAKLPSQPAAQAPAPVPTGPPPGMGPRPPAQASSGRATHRGAGRPLDESLVQRVGQMSVGSSGDGNGSGNGNGDPIGRGNMRGKRQVYAPPIRTRPEKLDSKKGSSGQQVIIQANYFSLVSKTDWCLNQYRVDFKPTIDSWPEKKRLLRDQANNIGGQYIFDGTVMYTSQNTNLPKQPNQEVEFYSQREDGSQVQVAIRFVGDLMMGDSHYLQFFNILTRKCLKLLNLQLIQRNYYDPKARVDIPEFYLELWPGYKTTIHQHEREVLLCAEITHKVMRTDTCLILLNNMAKNNPRDYRNQFTNDVVGTVVLTDYNNKTYVVSDVNWDASPSSTFDRNGQQVSYMSYYQERYNIKIKHQNQPLLVSKNKPRDRRAAEQTGAALPGGGDPNIVYLIPELCRMTGLTDDMRANFHLMRAMASHTRIGPGERIQRLMTMNKRLSDEERVQREFTDWNMRLDRKLVEIPARVLQPESIILGNNIGVPSGDEADWTKQLRSNPMFVMPQAGLSRWVIMFPSRVGRDAESFVDSLKTAAKGMRFLIADPEYYELPDDRNQTYINNLDQVISRQSPQLIFVVLMNNKADRYSAIKKKTLVDRAVPTQLFLAKNLTKKGVMSIATKVAIQINCKIGGAPWSIENPLAGVMVIGFDVCHDAKAKGKSYGAMVASLNRPMSRYFSAVSHHSSGEELSNDLAINIVKALESYKKHNGAFPTHIIIYRDGVGDGQIPYVKEHEVAHIERAITTVMGLAGQTPKLAFVIVSKRINTRLFQGKNNPRPGTVVDDVITLPERYDFFIVSQFVNQGTVSPTSYNVIHDTTGLTPDRLQRLTFKLTHMYYNWSGTVRVPAPTQYAHKLAFLVSQSLHRAPNQSLEELLFFL